MAAVRIDSYETEKKNMPDDVDKLPPISIYDVVTLLMNTKSVYNTRPEICGCMRLMFYRLCKGPTGSLLIQS